MNAIYAWPLPSNFNHALCIISAICEQPYLYSYITRTYIAM